MIQNVGTQTYGYGIGILLYNNFYADVTDNVLENVRAGIQTGNFYRVNPGTTGKISNNVINSWRTGIFHNLWYSNASTISVDHNTINAIPPPGAADKWNGILLTSFGGNVNTVISGNVISVPSTLAFTDYTAGYNVWNDTTTAALTIEGGSVTGAKYGVWVNNYEGYSSNAGNTRIIVNGVTIEESEIGINVWDSPLNTNNSTVTATLTNNTITNSNVGVQVSGQDATATGDHNQINGVTDILNLSENPLIFEQNWWGSILGPAPAPVNVEYDPWCGDAACTFLVGKNAKGEIVLEDTINVPGGIVVDQPNTTILLKNGTVIQNDSPCFVVNASNTTIMAETPGGAKCVPTGGSNGIDVAAGLSGIRIINMEIDGTGQTTGDGIHFAGAVSDFQIVDNYIHDLDGDGVEFAGVVAGDTQDIQGNLFQNNTGLAINAGSNAINAEYNSWGQVAATTIANVDTDPWTHVDLYIEPSGTASNNQVLINGQFSITVKANLQNVTGASFEFLYDTTKLDLVSAAATTAFDPITGTSVLDTSTDGVIKYDGQKSAGVSDTEVALFTAVFEAKVAGEAAFSFNADTDQFAMSPAYGPSNYIYAAALTGATVQVIIDPPTISSTDIQGYYLTGEAQEFNVRTINPSTGGTYAHVLFNYVITGAEPGDITEFQYWDGAAWQAMPLTDSGDDLAGSFGPTGGFPMGTEYDVNTLFRITFATAKSYPFTLTLNDLDAGDYALATLASTANVYDPPILSSTDIAGPYLGAVQREFQVTLDNPDTGIETNVKAKFTLYGAQLSDITSIQYETADGSWEPLPLSADGDNLVGYFGPSTGFLMTAPYNATSQFRVTFADGITKSYNYDIELFDTSTMPDRSLTKLTGRFDVYANYSLTGTFSMQGRVFRGGVPVTLTGPVGFAFGPYTAHSTDVLGVNWTLSDVAAGVYTITTNQPRYLNVTADLGKAIDVTKKTAINALELKGGDANLDNEIGLSDASAVGSAYGQTGDRNADVNFSGRVDIFDLALVGGNYLLTAEGAYAGWTP